MPLKNKPNEALQLSADSSKPHVEDGSEVQALTHEQISRRAYEIYLQRDGLPGSELADWLIAEAELRTVIQRKSIA
jgi:DUF2934 family protein